MAIEPPIVNAKPTRTASQTEEWIPNMIVLTRLNGPTVALNPDLIERAEATPDTIISMVDGTKYVVIEPLAEVIDRIRLYRASVVALSQRLDFEITEQPTLRLVHGAHEDV